MAYEVGESREDRKKGAKQLSETELDELRFHGGRSIEVFQKAKSFDYTVPALLHATQESRKHAQDRYTLCFDEELESKPVWVDFSRDSIVFADAQALWAFYGFEEGGTPDLTIQELHEKLPQEPTTLEMETRFLAIGSPLSKILMYMISRFRKLESVTLANRPDFAGSGHNHLRYTTSHTLKADTKTYWGLVGKDSGVVLGEPPKIVQLDLVEFQESYWKK